MASPSRENSREVTDADFAPRQKSADRVSAGSSYGRDSKTKNSVQSPFAFRLGFLTLARVFFGLLVVALIAVFYFGFSYRWIQNTTTEVFERQIEVLALQNNELLQLNQQMINKISKIDAICSRYPEEKFPRYSIQEVCRTARSDEPGD